MSDGLVAVCSQLPELFGLRQQSGNIPDQASKDKLQALSIANARTPVPVNNQLVIDPTVPRTIGVRVVELTSARFDEGSAKVAGAHAKELDRITAIMNGLPNISVLIGSGHKPTS